MQKAKKIMSLLLAIAMLAAFAVPSAFAAEFSDVPESYQYYDAVQSLVARGIVDGYTDGTFKPEDTISRAEFCKMVVYSIGMGEISQGAVAETGFPDVAADFWAAGVIKVARDMNIINGYDDGTFKPDEKVTYDQAIKMVVCAKSEKFATAADKNGGFPTGYRKVATAYNFVKNITDGVYNDPAKRGTIAKLIDNMLNIKMSEITNDSSAIDTSSMEEIKGQVVAVYGASLDSATSSLTKYQIKITLNSGDTKTYNCEDLGVKNELRSYLGKMVVAYYKEDIGLSMQRLSSLSLQKNKNGETTVDVSDIAEYTATSLSYYDENSDTEKISVSSSAKILYNGLLSTKKFADAVAECENQSGSIRFLSTSGEGGTAEVLFFTVYKNIVVTSVTASSKLVYGEDVNGKVDKYEINDSDVNKNVTITKNGSSVSFSAIAKNQVLSISESEDKTQVEVLIGPDSVTGRVASMTRGEKEISIGCKTYKFATGVTMGDVIEVGANLKLYLDAFNKIAKYEFQAASDTYTYAYLTKIANVGTGMDADIRVELINLSGSSIKDATYYTLADKVTINNKTYRPADDFATIKQLLIDSAARYAYTDAATGKVFGAGSDEVHQPLKYTLSNGKISTLLIGKDDATDADLRYNRSALDSKDGFKCTTDKVGLAGQYTLNSSTKVLYVPANPDQANISKYTLRTGTNSGFNADAFYRVVLVDLNQSKTTPALVLVYSTGSSAPTSSDWVSCQPGVVTKVSSVENADTITVIDVSGNETVYYDEDKEFSGKVAIGDVIRLSVDASKNIEDMELLASGSQVYAGQGYLKTYSHQDTKNMQNDESGNVVLIREGSNISQDTAQSWLALGTAFEVQDSTLKMSLGYLTTSGKDDIELGNKGLLKSMSASGAKMISVNFAKDGTVKNIDAKDTEISQLKTYKTATTDADKVFVYRSYGTTKLIVVFRAEQ